MSASIFYQPINGKRLTVSTPSSFLAALERAFGQGPWQLNQSHYSTLRGLAAGMDDEEKRRAIEDITDAIQQHDAIRVWAEY